MALNNFDEDQFDQESFGGEYEPEPQKPKSNRTFLIALAIVGILFVIALILFMVVLPRIAANNTAAKQEQGPLRVKRSGPCGKRARPGGAGPGTTGGFQLTVSGSSTCSAVR